MPTKLNKIIVKATNLEVSVKISIDAEIVEEGKFCVHTKNFSDIIKELPEDNIEIKLNCPMENNSSEEPQTSE